MAGGVYYPDEGAGHTLDDRDESFILPGDVVFEGSYIGLADPQNADDRDLWNPYNYSILMGDIGNPDDYSDNSYTIVIFDGNATITPANAFTKLDGFVIEQANNDFTATGAGIFINNCEPTILNCFITDNHCHGASDNGLGGGMYITGTLTDPPLLPIVQDSWFLANTGSTGAGAAITSIPAQFDNVIFEENIASTRGGGGAVYTSALFTNCDFNHNEVDAAAPNLDGGGGVFSEGINSEPRFRECNFQQNIARNAPGGAVTVKFNSGAYIRCTFLHNKSIAEELPLAVAPETNPGNVAGGRGAAMYVDEGANIVDCVFHGDSVWDEEEGTITGRGGGIYVRKYIASLVNCEFWNCAATRGGGLYAENNVNESPADPYPASIDVHNCTFVKNGAVELGGGADALGGGFGQTFTNCIFWHNEGADTDPVRNNLNATTGSINYSCLEDATVNGSTIYGGTGNIDADPKFEDEYAMDAPLLQLRSNSPCIDSGNTPPVPADQFDVNAPDGNLDEKTPDLLFAKRVMDDIYVSDVGMPIDETDNCGVVDMGAFELPRVCGTGLLGDMNGDGVVDVGDITLFDDCMNAPDLTSANCRCADMNHDFNKTKADVTCFANALVADPPCIIGVPCEMPFEGFSGGGGGQNSQSMQGEGNGGGEMSFEGFPEPYVEFLTWLLDHPREDYQSMSDQEYTDWIGDIAMNMIFGVPMP